GVGDVVIGGLWLPSQQTSGCHDLSWLAVTALCDLFSKPSSLNRMAAVDGQTLNGRYFLSLDALHRRDAGSYGVALQVPGATSPLPAATTIFGPHQMQIFPQPPQQRFFRLTIERRRRSVHFKVDSHEAPPSLIWTTGTRA